MSETDAPITVSVSILDREYQVACSPGERDALVRAADHLDAKMRQIRATGKIVGLERIAVMAALNLTHEALSSEGEKSGLAEGTQREVDRLSEKLGRALGDIRQMKI